MVMPGLILFGGYDFVNNNSFDVKKGGQYCPGIQ
jgi:hypothetical protein